MAVNVRERERERRSWSCRPISSARSLNSNDRANFLSLCFRYREFCLLTVKKKKKRGNSLRFVIKNIVSIGNIFFLSPFFDRKYIYMASFGGIFISIGIISPLCRGSLFERRESLFLRYPVCTGKYFSVNISAQERLHLVIERYPKLFRCLQDFQFSLSNVSLPIYNEKEKEKEGKKERMRIS